MAGKRRFGRVRKLPSGRYQARYRGPDGVDRPADRTFRTVKDADMWLARKEQEMEDGRWLDPDDGSITIEQWGKRWFAAASPELKAKTRALYEGLIRLWINPRLGAYRLADVRPITVTEWLGGLKRAELSASRIRTAYRVFSQMMQSAADNDLIAMTPCRGIKLPRLPEPQPRILADDEVARLVAAMRPPHDLFVKLLAFAGLRIGEAFALRRRDIDLDAGVLLVDEELGEIGGRQYFDTPKNHQRRRLTLPVFLVDELRAHLANKVGKGADALLFVGRTGKPLRYNSWRTWRFDKGAERAGLTGVTPHDLRATHATWVADRHGVMAAAARLGHSNASVTTRHYARIAVGRDAHIARTLHAELGTSESASGTAGENRACNGHDGDDDGVAGVLAPV